MVNKKKSVNEKLSEALEVEYEEEEKASSIVKREDNLPISQDRLDGDLQKDYGQVRNNLKDLISTGRDAIDGILNVAIESDAPRAYEVASQMIKTVSEMNKDLIDLHQRMNSIRKEDIEVTNTTNNSIYVGSTSDLQDLINQSRSAKKALQNYDDILEVDAEIIDDQ